MLQKKLLFSHNSLTVIALIIGVITGLLNNDALLNIAETVSEITIKLMKFIALPLLFLSVVTSAAHFASFHQIKKLGVRIFKYTLFTTFIAAFVAEGLFWLVAPRLLSSSLDSVGQSPGQPRGFFSSLLDMIPDNIVGVFLENNVIAVVIMAIVLAIALLSINGQERNHVFNFFNGLLTALMRIVRVGLRAIPISVWAFVTILTDKILSDHTNSLNALGGLTITVITANLIQGLVILPLLLRYKGISPRVLMRQVKEALLVAFFTRSSMATLPITLEKAIDEAKISSDVARLSLPLCTTINMNGCAQFILLSVYFVSAYTGNTLSVWEHVGMIFLSVIAAIGNAGVPMGCFFLASSILASKDIPLYLMGSILPLYTFIDMVETSLNVWSDVSITKIVDKENAAANQGARE
jgi:Na+/H+-dicarboxylate symporter